MYKKRHLSSMGYKVDTSCTPVYLLNGYVLLLEIVLIVGGR